MSDIVNLRMARKRKTRADKERMASQNRALFGVPKAERKRSRTESEKAVRFVDAHRLERDDGHKA
ncbi:MAG: DUF4169 family protein [Rhizobiaceae bacterium]|nr:DUF4169 family protein [Rhizobiaceae bacterium]